MAGSYGCNELALLPKSPLLITESENEFESLRSALVQEIEPRRIVEHIYGADIADIIWESRRLRRCKAAMINIVYQGSLRDLLHDVSKLDRQEAGALAEDWFTDKKAKKQVKEILSQFQLDESAIEAEEIKRLAPELEMLDRMLTMLEGRRHRAIRGIAEYRESFAKKVRESSDRIIEGNPVVRLENPNGQKSA